MYIYSIIVKNIKILSINIKLTIISCGFKKDTKSSNTLST